MNKIKINYTSIINLTNNRYRSLSLKVKSTKNFLDIW